MKILFFPPALLTAVAAVMTAVLAGPDNTAYAQLARKPSYYEQQAITARQKAAAPGRTEGEAATLEKSPGLAPEMPDALSMLANTADFASLARVYFQGTPMEIPHLLFVVDLAKKPVHIDYINTPRFELHERFIRQHGIAPKINKAGVDRNYLAANRRFIFGTLSWQQHLGRYTYEFWEGDQITPALLAITDRTVKASFFAPVIFKTNATLHAMRAQQAGVAFVTQEALVQEQPFMALNQGSAVGRLRIADSTNDLLGLTPQDIVVLRQVPISLPPVAGVITERPSTVLSHVNLLAKGWGIPNAYLVNAAKQLQEFDGEWVVLEVSSSDYRIRRATPDERRTPLAGEAVRLIASPDLDSTALSTLTALGQRGTSSSRQCGAKAANLGVVRTARIASVVVPDGFCIPFAHYDRFMRHNGLAARLAGMEQLPGFASDSSVRKLALAQLRQEIAGWPLQPSETAHWQRRWANQLNGGGVFVRSSSNSEDLAHFSGAGLYSTVPNVTSGPALDDAVRQVWASVFNFEAYEARRAAGIAHNAVVMAVLVQTAVNSTSAGVMLTRDPFDATRPNITYISAKRGLGIKVVEGQRIAEQVMYSSRSKAVQIISRSDETSSLQLDPAGGVQEVQVSGRAVLTDDTVRRLSAAADAVKRKFRGHDQDIEWAMLGQQIILLQARPYVEGKKRVE